MSILKPKNLQTKTLSFRLPVTVVAEIEDVKNKAEAIGLSFDLTEHVERAITSIVRTVRNELAAHEKQPAQKAK